MRDTKKTKAQLIEELAELRARDSGSGNQEQMEERLRRLELFVAHAGTGITGTDDNGLVVEWNPAAERIFGYSAQEILGEPLSKLLPPDRLDEPKEIIERLKRGEHVVRLETERVAKDGRLIPIELSLVLTDDGHGKPNGLTAIVLDITERKRVEKTLRESEARFRSAFEHGAIGMAIIDRQGRFQRVNAMLCEMLGYSAEELCEMRSMDITHSDDLVKTKGTLQEIQDEGGSVTLRKRYVRKDGEVVHAIVAGAPYYDESAGEQVYFTQFVDVTEKKRLEAHLFQSEKMNAIGTLAGGVAHDMNNVLAVVLGLGSVLEKKLGPDDSMRRDIQEIMSAARRGKSLVENLLGFARKGKYQREIIYLNEIVNQLFEMLGLSLSKKVVMNLSLDDELAPVECDSAQMTQTLMNLCLNANDALDGSGTMTITTCNEVLGPGDVAGLEAGQYVKLQIKDNGSGMDEETQRKAFEPFFTTKDVGKGTGLGLSMAYGVIDNHGGAILIDSSPGEGTAVNIWLPAVEQPEAQDSPEAPRHILEKRKAKILLVDDEQMIRKVGKRMISAIGHDVILADSGSAALDSYRNDAQDIDLVVLDLSMPIMDGAECFEMLREIDPTVRVLICTGHGKREDTEEMLSNGAVGLVRKPFDLDELSEAIDRVLGKQT